MWTATATAAVRHRSPSTCRTPTWRNGVAFETHQRVVPAARRKRPADWSTPRRRTRRRWRRSTPGCTTRAGAADAGAVPGGRRRAVAGARACRAGRDVGQHAADARHGEADPPHHAALRRRAVNDSGMVTALLPPSSSTRRCRRRRSWRAAASRCRTRPSARSTSSTCRRRRGCRRRCARRPLVRQRLRRARRGVRQDESVRCQAEHLTVLLANSASAHGQVAGLGVRQADRQLPAVAQYSRRTAPPPATRRSTSCTMSRCTCSCGASRQPAPHAREPLLPLPPDARRAAGGARRSASTQAQRLQGGSSRVVAPLYRLMRQEMNKKTKRGKPLGHTRKCNYDDFNEYFWSPSACATRTIHGLTARTTRRVGPQPGRTPMMDARRRRSTRSSARWGGDGRQRRRPRYRHDGAQGTSSGGRGSTRSDRSGGSLVPPRRPP